MSYQVAFEPVCTYRSGSIELRVQPRERDLGEFVVRRVLPAPQRRMVGPFVFFDHMGPAEFPPGRGLAVRPHPHIGIATITYLFEGEIMHRDSLGVEQLITAGAVNLMVAGHGITHSERVGNDLQVASKLHGIQSWIALPEGQEEMAPGFTHYPRADLPDIALPGARVRLIMGHAYGHASPVETFSRTLYLEVLLEAGATLSLPSAEQELALYVVAGSVRVGDETVEAGVMAVVCKGDAPTLTATESSRIMVIGGEALGHRHMFWNFVSSRPERIEQAKADWRDGRFPLVPGDDEYIALPD
ncbi:MAG: pirin family protein [Pseudomonadota bacterium]